MLEGAREKHDVVEEIISEERTCLCDTQRQKRGQRCTYSDIYSEIVHIKRRSCARGQTDRRGQS